MPREQMLINVSVTPRSVRVTAPLRLIAALCFYASISSCSNIPQYNAEGEVAGQTVNTTVDSEIAQYYLTKYLRGGGSHPDYDRKINALYKTWGKRPLDADNVRQISQQFSPDFAALFFVSRLYANPLNRKAHEAFQSHLAALRMRTAQKGPKVDQSYLFTFVPGFAYKKDTTTGADFARQRRIMEQAGLKTFLIEIDELGTVENNAAIIARELMRLGAHHDKIILVSVSKGGPEAALALGKLMTPGASAKVKAWISIGGILRGTPLADRSQRWPGSWRAKIVLFFLGLPWDVVDNVSVAKRKAVFDTLVFPKRILMLQYVGVPLSGQVSKDVRGRYESLRALGPNDGLTLLPDELVQRGMVITDIGLDHYYRDPEIDLKTLALARVVLDVLGGTRRHSSGAILY
jgi:hypothetical protein